MNSLILFPILVNFLNSILKSFFRHVQTNTKHIISQILTINIEPTITAKSCCIKACLKIPIPAIIKIEHIA